MPSLSKNIVYNTILALSGYVFPLLTFPYITRVLGPEGIGMVDFSLSIVDYAILISTLGLGTIGTREIAKCRDKEKLNKTFSSLMSLHIIMMALTLIVYFAIVFTIEKTRLNYQLYLVGTIKIVFNVFLIEWLFSGLQDFKYITIRSLLTKTLYVIAVFALVRKHDDVLFYFAITVLQVLINAVINWSHSRSFVSFSFSLKKIKNFIGPVVSLGTTQMLLSIYSSFIVLYLGFVCGDQPVGYYSTSVKVYGIMLSILSAFNGVLIPYQNSLYGKGDEDSLKRSVGKSLNLVLVFSLPLAVFCYVMAEDIIMIIAGTEFQRSVFPFRIIIAQVILVGISQVTEMQVLLTMNKMKFILYSTLVSVALSVLIMILFSSQYAEVAAAYAIMIPHIIECVLLYYFAKKSLDFPFPYRSFMISILGSIIIGIECFILSAFINSLILRVVIVSLIVFATYITLLFLTKETLTMQIAVLGKSAMKN